MTSTLDIIKTYPLPITTMLLPHTKLPIPTITSTKTAITQETGRLYWHPDTISRKKSKAHDCLYPYPYYCCDFFGSLLVINTTPVGIAVVPFCMAKQQ